MYLKRFAYPCRYGDLVYHFARPVPEISIITNHIPHNGLDLRSVASSAYKIQSRFALSPPKLLQYAEAIEQAGAALNNCWGFVDGTMRPVCWPNENQQPSTTAISVSTLSSFRLSLCLMD